MKKQLIAGLLLAAASLSAVAQDNGALTLYGLQDYTVYSMSPNGKWAVGYFQNGAGSYYPFRWNLETDENILLCRNNDEGWAYGVSDNGVVVGSYSDYTVSSNGAPTTAGGYYDESGWHLLEPIAGFGASNANYATEAHAVSADGQWIGGYAYSTNGMMPVVWRNGKIHRVLSNGYQGNVFGISNDGSKAAGWTYTANSGGQRVSVVWDVETGEATYICGEDRPWFSRCARNFTSDGRYVLHDEGIYDTQTGTNIELGYYYGDMTFNCLYCYLDDSLRVYGYEQSNTGNTVGVVYHNGTYTLLNDYIDSLGVDVSHLPLLGMLSFNCASADGQTLSIVTYDNNQYERPLIVRLGQNVTTRQPAGLTASQVDGLGAAKLMWKAPVNNPANLTGYNVYRDGTKVNVEPIAGTSYIDNSLAYGSYSYTVTALYDAVESAMSDAAIVTIGQSSVSAPRSLYARQRGYNSAALTWEAPATNLVQKNYYSDESDIIGFGGGNYSFEFGIKYDYEEMSAYSGYRISKVSFIPRSAQGAWEVRIYNGSTLLYSQPITQELTYGVENTVALSTPVEVSSITDDVICAIAVTVSSSSDNVVGMVETECTPGYSDLVHLSTETEFYSLSEQSREGGYVFDVAFAMSMILSPADAADNIDEVAQYNVYDNGLLIGSTDELSYLHKNVANGTHSYEIEAQYADGRLSPKANVSVDIAANSSLLPTIDEVYKAVDGTSVLFAWQTPTDDDKQNITYSGNNYAQTVAGPESSNYGYVARAIYSGNKLRGLGGYLIKQLRFYPCGDALFTFTLYENGNEVAYYEVDDYTLNTWNVVTLDEPVVIDPNAEYTLDLDCFDGVEGQGPLGCDNLPSMPGYSNLYSVDSGTSFDQLGGTSDGNWMMGMVAVAPDAEPLPVSGYNVRIDGASVTASPIIENTYTHDFGAGESGSTTHRVNIDVYYTGMSSMVRGTTNFFTLNDVAAGIEGTAVADMRVYPNPAVDYVAVDGAEVDAMMAYSVSGSLVAQAKGNRLDVSSLAGGIYILKVKAGANTHTVKLIVKR